LSVDANISEKHTVSIFRAEVAMLGSGGIFGWEDRTAEGVGQSGTRNEGEKVPGQQRVSKQVSEVEGMGREKVEKKSALFRASGRGCVFGESQFMFFQVMNERLCCSSDRYFLVILILYKAG
jgi:hypothetical protein